MLLRVKNLKKRINLKKNLIAGFNLSCIGDKGPFTLISSKEGNTYADKIAGATGRTKAMGGGLML